jgi:hypothetical protein
MPRSGVLYRWGARVRTFFPELKPTQAATLALLSLGLALDRPCGLTTVAAYLAAFLARKESTVRQRLRELDRPADVQAGANRSEFDPALCFAALARWPPLRLSRQRVTIAGYFRA